MGVLLVCWCVVGVLLRCVVGVLLVFGVIYNCHNALWHFWGHLQVLQGVVAIVQHPKWVVAEYLCHSVDFWALKTLNEQIRSLLLTDISISTLNV